VSPTQDITYKQTTHIRGVDQEVGCESMSGDVHVVRVLVREQFGFSALAARVWCLDLKRQSQQVSRGIRKQEQHTHCSNCNNTAFCSGDKGVVNYIFSLLSQSLKKMASRNQTHSFFW